MENTLFKQTKIGSIPKKWEIAKIQNLIDNDFIISHLDGNHGALYPKSDEFVGNGIPYVAANSFINNRVNFNLCKRLTPERAKTFKKGVAKNGDILFAHNATVGPVALLETDYEYVILSTTATYYRLDESKLNSHYWLQFLSSKLFKRQYEKVMRQSTRSQVPITTQRTFWAVIPPLKEQQKIAQILSQWDEAIETTQNLINQLQLRKKGLMQELLSGKKRLAGFSDEWEEDKLGSYFTERKETGLDNLQLLSVGKEGVYPQDDSNKKDTSNSNKSKYKRICKGDIGYNTMRMWQGRSALSQLEGIVSPAYTILKPKENCDSVFFSHLFKLEEMIHKFYRNSQGMVSDTWMCKFKDFKIVKFNARISLEEQKAISKIIALADEEISEKEDYLVVLKQQKKGLMQQLLTGQKRVKVN